MLLDIQCIIYINQYISLSSHSFNTYIESTHIDHYHIVSMIIYLLTTEANTSLCLSVNLNGGS